MLNKFWKWLHAYCEDRITDAYMAVHHVNLKCSNCKMWSALVGITSLPDDNKEWQKTSCNNCGHIEQWNCMGGFWVSRTELEKHRPVCSPVEKGERYWIRWQH